MRGDKKLMFFQGPKHLYQTGKLFHCSSNFIFEISLCTPEVDCRNFGTDLVILGNFCVFVDTLLVTSLNEQRVSH